MLRPPYGRLLRADGTWTLFDRIISTFHVEEIGEECQAARKKAPCPLCPWHLESLLGLEPQEPWRLTTTNRSREIRRGRDSPSLRGEPDAEPDGAAELPRRGPATQRTTASRRSDRAQRRSVALFSSKPQTLLSPAVQPVARPALRWDPPQDV